MVGYNVKAHVRADSSGVNPINIKMPINPFCEIAMEEATRLKEKGVVIEIIAASASPAAA